ncbi:hypothetical protein RB2654_21258 [Rhodobacterales bacterium HTCC2654]|uniref:Uncharacterized protein n=1 Tax=Maritimibacter alkaliphilus HTCC2654 TaxID=314271 RepID=A3VKJ9_9RHOB|nr:hypothetical protein RB2654_21258 [Rhodobacterales bacterium HTCC2654] [Maritimibacter alkaliphilus HTCC2654]
MASLDFRDFRSRISSNRSSNPIASQEFGPTAMVLAERKPPGFSLMGQKNCFEQHMFFFSNMCWQPF